MELSPKIYHWLIRPKYLVNLYINNLISNNFNLHDKKVLDFGCGIGSSCSLFSPDKYLGIDLDSNRIKYAKELYPKYSFRSIKEKGLKDINQSFDYILIIAVLHHISSIDLEDILIELADLLNSNGKLLIIEPYYHLNSHFNNHFMSLFDNGQYIRTIDDYLKIFNRQNYKTKIIKKYKKLLFYNEIFFSAMIN
ncbi:hypothetical protein U472_02550 [Orenia metallireducens]|uniref:Methyltransferase type 12 domain-containing protein n=1 Tax=Orenia metallireducens TaxID=1413210 RepID=A0A1C0ACL1_9FIRM|nr:class I SAM-dependent methyltransferase [Orenia metallireducens]OCL28093.1 hypothetical protein U472_02550 [Orenia metallireducens]